MIKFKGRELPSGVIIREVENSILPSVTAKTIELPSRHGGLDFGRIYGMREVVVKIGIKAKSDQEVKQIVRQLASQLNSEKLEALELSDEPNIVYTARVTSDTKLSPLFGYGETEITFLCPNPFGQDKDEYVSDSFYSYKNEQLPEGTFNAYPVYTITIKADSSSFKLIHTTDDGEVTTITLVDNFVTGDIVIVDCEEGKITVNGSLANILTLDSDYFEFKVGNNRTDVEGEGDVVISYKKNWL